MEKTKVIFIDLTISNKVRYVCDIVGKLHDDGGKVTVFVKDKKDAHTLDRRLWVWKQETFIPHIIVDEITGDIEEPVIITTNKNLPAATNALILFDPLPVDHFDLYPLVIDFAEVYDSEKVKESRQRYKEVRDSGKFDLEYSKLGAFLRQ